MKQPQKLQRLHWSLDASQVILYEIVAVESKLFLQA